jgi:hypothetical protein
MQLTSHEGWLNPKAWGDTMSSDRCSWISDLSVEVNIFSAAATAGCLLESFPMTGSVEFADITNYRVFPGCVY